MSAAQTGTTGTRRGFLRTLGGATACGLTFGRGHRLPAAAALSPRLEPLAEGLSHPWGIGLLPDGRVLLSERVGRLRLWEGGRLFRISGVPKVAAGGQGGLLDVQPAPDFASSGEVFFAAVTSGAGGRGTEIFRAALEGSRLVGATSIFKTLPRSHGGRHFGCRIRFDETGHLVFGVGERGSPERAPDLGDDAGKIHRITRSGAAGADNPFVSDSQARATIYALGTRNPQGMAVHPETKRIWFHEHGPRGGDEVNLLRAGADYGWPRTTHGIDYDGTPIGIGATAPGVMEPLWVWVPSIAPSGMDFYAHPRVAEWQNSLFVGALAGRSLVRLSTQGESVIAEERLLEDLGERIREVRTAPDGSLYLLTDRGGHRGSFLRLTV